jgi:hypothetical protein
MSKFPASSRMAEAVLDEVVIKTVSTDITGYTINKYASIILDTSLTINIQIYSYDKVIENKRLTLTGEDFNSWTRDGKSYLDVFVKNNIVNDINKLEKRPTAIN